MRMTASELQSRGRRASALPCRAVSSADVCALIYGDKLDPAVADAVAAQTSGPREALVLPGRLAPALQAAGSVSWVWLLDGCTVPEPGALEALLAARDIATAPVPVILVSKVLGSDGQLHPDSTPRHEIFEKQHSVDAAERHLVQLRAAAPGSVLVATEVVDRFGLPRSDVAPGLDMYEWSARILRSWQNTGYLVPASVAVRSAAPVTPSWRHLLARARMLGGSAWSPSEQLWETFLLGRQAAGAARGSWSAQARYGVGTSGRSPSRRPRRMTGNAWGANRLKRR